MTKSIGKHVRTSNLLKKPKEKNDDKSSQRRDEESLSDDTEKEIAERKKKLELLYTIGNASRVGTRPGETLIPMTVAN